MNKALLVFLTLAVSAAIPARADISAITIVTNGNNAPFGGVWGTDSGASIGVTPAGKPNAPFLDPAPTGALDVPSGSYLLLLGYEDRFENGAVPAGLINLDLTVYYTTGAVLTATFTNNVLTTPSIWSKTSGNQELVIGSSGITDVDRLGYSQSSAVYGPDGVPDTVLEFSDTGTFNSGTPEPAFGPLLTLGLFGMLLFSRRFRGRCPS